MFGPLTVRDAVNDVPGALILDGNKRIVAMCKLHADAIDLATAWNDKRKRMDAELETMQSRGEIS